MHDANLMSTSDDRARLLHEAVGLGTPRYQRADIEDMAGIAHERSVKWWRAMGFPEIPEHENAFTDVDVEMVRRLGAIEGSGLVDDESIMRLARLLGASFSRIAEAQMAIVDQLVANSPEGMSAGTGADIEVLESPVRALLEDTLVYVWRRQLLAALGRRLQTEGMGTEAAVGFADLSGFTKLSQRVPAARLASLVDDFERAAFDVVSARGGRAVKLIGDEVMFVCNTLSDAVDIGLDLAARLREIPDMPEIHCGIAFGRTVSVGGDVFGPAANLAARLTTIARPGTIVIPRSAERELARDDIVFTRLRRTFDLKGLGETRVVAIRRAAGTASR
jgi:adenylate cyclase